MALPGLAAASSTPTLQAMAFMSSGLEVVPGKGVAAGQSAGSSGRVLNSVQPGACITGNVVVLWWVA